MYVYCIYTYVCVYIYNYIRTHVTVELNPKSTNHQAPQRLVGDRVDIDWISRLRCPGGPEVSEPGGEGTRQQKSMYPPVSSNVASWEMH